MIKTDQEKLPVRLKGRGDSLWVTLDPSHPAEHLQKHLDKVFRTLKDWTVNARVILDPGGQEGHEDLVNTLGDFLKETFSVGHVSGPPKIKPRVPKKIATKMNTPFWQNLNSDVLMVSGRVRSGQNISTKKHLVVLGDVNPGAEIIAGGDILVMGILRGTAIAGQPENEDAIIFALEFEPTQVQIGGYVAAGSPSSKKNAAEYAHVKDGAIIVENYLKKNPFADLPLPQLR